MRSERRGRGARGERRGRGAWSVATILSDTPLLFPNASFACRRRRSIYRHVKPTLCEDSGIPSSNPLVSKFKYSMVTHPSDFKDLLAASGLLLVYAARSFKSVRRRHPTARAAMRLMPGMERRPFYPRDSDGTKAKILGFFIGAFLGYSIGESERRAGRAHLRVISYATSPLPPTSPFLTLLSIVAASRIFLFPAYLGALLGGGFSLAVGGREVRRRTLRGIDSRPLLTP